MKTFRPLRMVGDKVVVTSYTGWHSVACAARNGQMIKLLPMPDIQAIKHLPVYNYSRDKITNQQPFEQLFWPIESAQGWVSMEQGMAACEAGLPSPYQQGEDTVQFYRDVEGIPAFSHQTSYHVATHYPNKLHLFEQLTVSVVMAEFERIFLELDTINWNFTNHSK